jgi:hypothetical protein
MSKKSSNKSPKNPLLGNKFIIYPSLLTYYIKYLALVNPFLALSSEER